MSKLFCDCKTDEEKSNFFLSGRGVETGVIAPAISNEVAMAFHRCFEFEKQLAVALAACKAKDEALNAIATTGVIREAKWCGMSAKDIAELALAIQPDESALKAWLGEPVAWRYELKAGEYTFSEKRYLNEQYAAKPTPLYAPKGMK